MNKRDIPQRSANRPRVVADQERRRSGAAGAHAGPKQKINARRPKYGKWADHE